MWGAPPCSSRTAPRRIVGLHWNHGVTFTFHYWSGTTVSYFVTKSGTSVTGTTT